MKDDGELGIKVEGEQGHSEKRVPFIQALSMKEGELDPGNVKRQ